MRRRFLPRLRSLALLAGLPLLALFSLASCGGDSTAPVPTLDGTWVGTFEGAAVEIVMSQSGEEVTAAGTFQIADVVLAVSGDGVFANPDLELEFSTEGFEPFTYSAELVSRTRLEGDVFGSGFTGENLILLKQQ